MFLPKEDSDKTMILSQLDNCTCSEPCSPVHNKSAFSFHIPDVSNINPFHVSFRPTCVSTPRKSHHVSMPALIRKPKQMPSYKTGSLGNMKLNQDFKVRPFSIKVASYRSDINNVTKCKAFKKPKAGRRSSLDREAPKNNKAQRLKINTSLWMKNLTLKMRIGFSCTSRQQHDIDMAMKRRRKHYFI